MLFSHTHTHTHDTHFFLFPCTMINIIISHCTCRETSLKPHRRSFPSKYSNEPYLIKSS